jgi:amino acid transporter
MCALGEMAAWIPLQSGFTGYATRFCDPSLGFSLGYTYWLKYIVLAPNQLTAAALTIQYWVPREKINPGVFIAIFLVAVLTINYLGVTYFGELEFWLSSLKVLTLCGLIILSIVLVLGGGPSHDRIGFRYWKNPGAFNEIYGSKYGQWFPAGTVLTQAAGDSGRFLAVWSAFIIATFAFLGCEIVGVTVGEAQNPRRAVPRAVKLTLWRIVAFYIVLVLL